MIGQQDAMRLRRMSLPCTLALLATLAVAPGCSKAPKLPTVPASGTVTLDGQPLEGASVAFTPTVLDGKPANGLTDAQGRFELKTYVGGTLGQAAGALPGDYIVIVTKYEGTSGAAPATGSIDPAQQQKDLDEAKRTGKPPAAGLQGQSKLITPTKYSNPTDTDLKATIKNSENQFTFDLKR